MRKYFTLQRFFLTGSPQLSTSNAQRRKTKMPPGRGVKKKFLQKGGFFKRGSLGSICLQKKTKKIQFVHTQKKGYKKQTSMIVT